MWRFAIIAVQCGKPVLCIYYLYSALSRYSEMQWIIHQYTVLIWISRRAIAKPCVARNRQCICTFLTTVNILPFVKASMYWQLNFPQRFHYLIASFFTYHILLLILWSFNHILQLRKQNLTDINMIRLYSY